MLSYFKNQSSISLSSVTYKVTSNYDFLSDYQKRVNEQEQCRKEAEKRAKEAYARKASEEARKAAEKMKDVASAADDATEVFQDFAKAYEDFVYWTAKEGGSPEAQWFKIGRIVDEIKRSKEKEQRAIRRAKIAAIAIICLRILFVVIAANIFVGFSGVDFIFNIGTFHFFDLYQGTSTEFVLTSCILIASIWNLWRGSFTDWIVSLWMIIDEKIASARERRKQV